MYKHQRTLINRTIIFLAIVALQEKALQFARQLLRPNGYFLCKLFQGQEAFQDMRRLLQTLFRVVHHIKPSSSREESPEMYLLALDYRADMKNSKVETNRTDMEWLIEEARRVRTKKKIKE